MSRSEKERDCDRKMGRNLEVKNKTAYEETLMTKNDANDANKNAKRFLSYVEKVLRERDEKS